MNKTLTYNAVYKARKRLTGDSRLVDIVHYLNGKFETVALRIDGKTIPHKSLPWGIDKRSMHMIVHINTGAVV